MGTHKYATILSSINQELSCQAEVNCPTLVINVIVDFNLVKQEQRSRGNKAAATRATFYSRWEYNFKKLLRCRRYV